MTKLFVLPNLETLLANNELGDKIVVIAIIGKSSFNTHGLKVKSIGRMFAQNTNRQSECTIEGYYDEENQLIYLHVHTMLDTDALIAHYDLIAQRCEQTHQSDDFLIFYNEVKSRFARSLLYVLHLSHIVIISHPSHSFDLNYIQYFKSVDILRHKLEEQIQEELVGIPDLSDEWKHTGRMCTPRLIFYFEKCPKIVNSVKKLEHNIEDQIYQILRKSRIINNSDPLFTIPPNDEYAFINTEPTTDRLTHAIHGLLAGCHQPNNSTSGNNGGVFVPVPFSNLADRPHTFAQFLRGHIRQARKTGFEDVVVTNRHGQSMSISPHFELPTLTQWANAAQALYNFMLTEEPVKSLCTETRFSKERCLKVLPIAIAKYQEGIPLHYGTTEHQLRLSTALTLFRAQARGPLHSHYQRQLAEECLTYWTTGNRQACEAPSLTGHGCELPIHGDDVRHCSGALFVAACDCGRTQGLRQDPYSPQDANETFYERVGVGCSCGIGLERIHFPVFKSNKENEGTPTNLEEYRAEKEGSSVSTTEYLPGMLTLSSPVSLLPRYNSWSLVCLGPSSLYSHNLGLPDSYQPGFLSSTNYLLPWDKPVYYKVRGGGGGNNSATPSTSSGDVSVAGEVVEAVSGGGVVVMTTTTGGGRKKAGKAGNSRLAHFTVKVFIGVEYECPKGHRFMMSGPETVLRAAPGYLVKDTGHQIVDSDMPLYHPCPCRQPNTSSTNLPSSTSSTTNNNTPSSASSSGNSNSTPNTGSNKPPPLMAQLQRIHCVTPKAPVTVRLTVRVAPTTSGVVSGGGTSTMPVFVPCRTVTSAEMTLVDGVCSVGLTQSAYWVLRLPYIYEGASESSESSTTTRTTRSGSHGDVLLAGGGRLLKGLFTVHKND